MTELECFPSNTFVESTPVPDVACGCVDNYDLTQWNDTEPIDDENGSFNPLPCGRGCRGGCSPCPPPCPCPPRTSCPCPPPQPPCPCLPRTPCPYPPPQPPCPCPPPQPPCPCPPCPRPPQPPCPCPPCEDTIYACDEDGVPCEPDTINSGDGSVYEDEIIQL